MGFNYYTLFEFVFGLLLPALVILFFIFSKNKKQVAYDSIAYGLGAFVGSMVAVFIAFILTNTLFLSGVAFSDDTSGLAIAGTVFGFMIAVLFVICESLKILAINKFIKEEVRNKYSSVGFSAGVVIAQSVIMFVALNIFENYEMSIGYAVFTGLFVLGSGIMYTALSYASECALRLGSKGAAYGISSVYYIFLIALIICISSAILTYIITAFFFAVSIGLAAVFIVRGRKTGDK